MSEVVKSLVYSHFPAFRRSRTDAGASGKTASKMAQNDRAAQNRPKRSKDRAPLSAKINAP